MQVLDANVRQGGPVYETGHILVLSLADNQRDQEVIWKILSQVSTLSTAAYLATTSGSELCQKKWLTGATCSGSRFDPGAYVKFPLFVSAHSL